MPVFSVSRLGNVEDFFNVNIFLNVNVSMSVNDYSLKYICEVYYLKLRFIASLIQSPILEILIVKIEMLLCFKIRRLSKLLGFN